jgi:hypothetical protein
MSLTANAPHIYGLAHSVLEDANRSEPRRFTPRPSNRFEPENTLWWIVPSTDWPAYRYGKGVLRKSDFQPAQVQCGLHVEKGFDPVAAIVYPNLAKRGHTLDKNWIWHQFTQDLANGKVGETAQAITDITGSPVVLEVNIWYPTDPEDFQPHGIAQSEEAKDDAPRPGEAGHIWFEVNGQELQKLGEARLTDFAREVEGCQRAGELVDFAKRDPVKWAWIDLYIGVLVSLAPGCPAGEGEESLSLVWQRLIRPWLPWIK